jgi:hypothetical protein
MKLNPEGCMGSRKFENNLNTFVIYCYWCSNLIKQCNKYGTFKQIVYYLSKPISFGLSTIFRVPLSTVRTSQDH